MVSPIETLRLKRSLKERAAGINLIQNTQGLLSRVREPKREEKEVLEKAGFVFLPTFAKSLREVFEENSDHFANPGDFVSTVSGLADYVPPTLTVGINPKKPFILRSFGKSQAEQLKMIERQSKALQERWPDGRIVMLPISTYAQADIACLERTGKKLFGEFFVRALDQNSGFFAATVGRLSSDGKLRIGDCYYTARIPSLGALAAMVFVGK